MGLEVMIPENEIALRVRELAKQIRDDFGAKSPFVLGVMTGSFMFMADLLRMLEEEGGPMCRVDVVLAKSYRGTDSRGVVEFDMPFQDIKGRFVLVVEDIVDTGLTMAALLDGLRELKPAELKMCSLLSKSSRRKHEVKIDYLGFEIDDEFVVGYGLDKDGAYRQLPFVGVIRED